MIFRIGYLVSVVAAWGCSESSPNPIHYGPGGDAAAGGDSAQPPQTEIIELDLESIHSLTSFDGRVFFVATDAQYGAELWVSDGTVAGTELLGDINPGEPSSEPTWLTVSGGLLYFVADDGVHGRELWKTDGTRAGTTMLYDSTDETVMPPTPRSLIDLDGVLNFSATGTGGDWAWWKTDGSPGGTVPLKTLPSDGRAPVIHQGHVYFSLWFWSTVTSDELWKSDGTEAGTVRVASIPTIATKPITSGSLLFFLGDDDVHGTELWQSDGTTAGTHMVEDVVSSYCDEYCGFWQGFVDFNGVIVFQPPDSDCVLWRTTGTPGSTVSFFTDSSPQAMYLTATSKAVYFVLTIGGDTQLWQTDATEEGTVAYSVEVTSPRSFTVIDGSLYFIDQEAPESVDQVWRIDGNNEAPTKILDLNATDGRKYEIMEHTGSLFLTAGTSIWVQPIP
ncbi:ELWxxDGT repeat protein [Myxococcota bacterium]